MSGVTIKVRCLHETSIAGVRSGIETLLGVLLANESPVGGEGQLILYDMSHVYGRIACRSAVNEILEVTELVPGVLEIETIFPSESVHVRTG